jgi:GTPase SAR1 family protein
LFRLDAQEYNVEDQELKGLLSHIISSVEKNVLIFTFDITNAQSLRQFTKKAIRELIFSFGEASQGREEKLFIPFMIIGMKADLQAKAKVNKEEVRSMMDALQKYVQCEILYIDASSEENIVKMLSKMFELSEGIFFH